MIFKEKIMVAYLELDELIKGKTYECETYHGIAILLKYVGAGDFSDIHGSIYSVYGEVRYVFKMVEREIDEI